MVDISISIDVSVKCSNCDGDLHAEFDQGRDIINVDLCDSCLKDKYNEGYEQGQLDTH